MPYADKEKQREAKREWARRTRAAQGTAVEPVVSAADLAIAGDVLRHRQGASESDAEYRARLRAVWRSVQRVVG